MIEPGLALENLRRARAGREVPLFWDRGHDNILYGKSGKTHTVLIQTDVPKLDMHYEINIIGDGRVLDHREGECHTWHRNYHNFRASSLSAFIANGAFGVGFLSGKDTGGANRASFPTNSPFVQRHSTDHESSEPVNDDGYLAGETDDASGIVVGTGTADEDFEDFALDTQIDHGEAAGELYYATSRTPADDQFNATTRIWEYALTRYFDNFNADETDITINEMAQYSRMRIGNVEVKLMLARDLVSPGLVVPFRAQAAIKYTYSLVFPSSGSPLRNWFNMVFSLQASLNASDSGSFGDGELNGKDTGGGLRSETGVLGFPHDDNMFAAGKGYTGGLAADTHGILVGDSSTDVTFNDFAMSSLIAHGVAGGQLQYARHDTPAGSWDLPTLTYTVSHVRTLTNGSGGLVTVREIGLVGLMNLQGDRNIMTHRDVVSDIAIADTEDLEVIHQFNTLFPE